MATQATSSAGPWGRPTATRAGSTGSGTRSACTRSSPSIPRRAPRYPAWRVLGAGRVGAPGAPGGGSVPGPGVGLGTVDIGESVLLGQLGGGDRLLVPAGRARVGGQGGHGAAHVAR